MSIIAVKGRLHSEGKASYIVGYDSMTTKNQQNMHEVSPIHKVQKYSSDHATLWFGNIGYTKRLSMMQAFMEDNTIPTLPSELDVLEFMKDFYEFSDIYLEADRKANDNGKNFFEGESVLINKFGKQVWAWSFNHFSVTPIKRQGYFAIGSGSKAALGALHAGASMKNAVEATCKVDKSCGPPVYQQIIEYKI